MFFTMPMKIKNQVTTWLVVVLLLVSCSNNKHEIAPEKVKVALRAVGHHLLLAQNDSTSLVLPIEQISTSKYQLSFEKEITIVPDSLTSIISYYFNKASLPAQYIVEVIPCSDEEIAYSYQVQETKDMDIIPCKGRNLPGACYLITVEFLVSNTSPNQWIWVLFIFLGGILTSMIFYSFKKKNYPAKSIEDHEIMNIGHFSFYPKQHKLVKQSDEISLSKKECELLLILVTNANNIITREELTKKIWEDNGVIVGRSLDTYISKLRKKLKDDTNIKIVNVHGIGYKLELKSV
ncbi:Transcriptional regulatory protein, C terminal [Zhouia amylolytica]|uniref:Transcriptional regulatory protein, C terminal n=2 Tax=Zhouia amylolytica TaxID=376730 RepID=A0A1I6VTW2_9FLAO|nr:Transcriptional regulatory protein, C terminal [Zhouia amylolytica]